MHSDATKMHSGRLEKPGPVFPGSGFRNEKTLIRYESASCHGRVIFRLFRSRLFGIRDKYQPAVLRFYRSEGFHQRFVIPVRAIHDDDDPVFLHMVDQIVIIVAVKDIQLFFNRVVDHQIRTHHAASPGDA